MGSRSAGGDDDHQGHGSDSLSELMSSWRRRAGLLKKDVAALAGCTERWYYSLAKGENRKYSAELLDSVSAVLALADAERNVLYLKAVGHLPPPASRPGRQSLARPDGQLQHFLDIQAPHPAFATNHAWDITGTNAPFLDWFPWARWQANFLRWVFLDPRGREQLVNWQTDWAPSLLGLLRYARARNPGDEALRRVERDILAGSPAAREMWRRHEVRDHEELHPRRMRLPYHQGRDVPVALVGFYPMRDPRLRIVVIMDLTERAPAGDPGH